MARNTGRPPAPKLPQPLLKALLLVAFVAAAWFIFSPLGDSGDSEDAPTEEPTEEPTEAPLLPPSLRIVGNWAYVLNDEESARRASAEKALAGGTDDPISRAMIEQLDLQLKDRLAVTGETVALTSGGTLTAWSWEALQEGVDDVTLILSGSGIGESRGKASFEGRDWMSLKLEDKDGSRTLRWRRAEPEAPPLPPREEASPESPEPPPAGTP